MTTTRKSAAAKPANMHTDLKGSQPHALPLNMHTDVVIAKVGSTVTITGTTDENGRVSVRLPTNVAGALKQKATATKLHPVAEAEAGAAAHIVYVFDGSATVGGTLSSGLTITGPAQAGGTATSVVLTISQDALTTLRVHRDVL